jgi:uncharacterized membrane protein
MEILFTLGVVLFLIGPILGLVALVQISGLKDKVRRLSNKLEEANFAPQSQPQPLEVPTVKEVVDDPPLEEAPAPTSNAWKSAAASAPPAAEEPVVVSEPAYTAPEPSGNALEQALASRWLVWIGGAAIGLAGLLFVKYAHDQGLIPPIIRVIVGLAFGAALVAAGEWLRIKRGPDGKDFVPAALSAGGLIIAFGVSYAAYGLYNIVAPAVCFPLLAAISLGALWLSQRQGQLIAALGLIGATLTPALISNGNSGPSGFFSYMLVIVIASLWLLRKLPWWWLGYAALASGLGWGILWITGRGVSPSLPIGIFGLAIGAAAVLVPRGKGILEQSMGSLWDPKTISPPMGVAIAGCVAGSIILSALAVQSGHIATPLVLFAIGMAAIVVFGWFRNGLVAAPLLVAGLTFVVLMAWRDVGFHEWAFDERGFWVTVPGLIEPPRFRNAMLIAMAGFTAVGVFGCLQKSEQRPWAVLAATSSFLFVFGAWARADFTLSWQTWSLIALAAATALGFAAWRLVPKINHAASARSVEVLVAGIAALLLFVLDRAFDAVWLTMAVAVLATAIAYLTRIVPLPNIAGIASIVASFAALRLFVGREFWGDDANLFLGKHWALYGYGVPAVLFWQASRWLNREGFDRWRVAFEGISLGLLISLVSIELRVLIGGGITNDEISMLEWAAHGCAWLGAAYGLAYRQKLYSGFVSLWGARALLVGATFAFVLLLTTHNPVFSYDAVEGGQVFNALWLAYLFPVPLYALLARKLHGLGWESLRSAVGVFALVLLMAFVTLFVKRQFQDATIDFEFLSQAESYAVSAAWLVTGVLIFIAGLKLDRQTIRYGGLAVIVLTVLKVFGYDLFQLGGLWRIASIMGLGLCLVGIGWLYTKYVGQPAKSVEV